jgi:hypothetical protein
MKLTDQELQSLQNQGGEAEIASNEIIALRAANIDCVLHFDCLKSEFDALRADSIEPLGTK